MDVNVYYQFILNLTEKKNEYFGLWLGLVAEAEAGSFLYRIERAQNDGKMILIKAKRPAIHDPQTVIEKKGNY